MTTTTADARTHGQEAARTRNRGDEKSYRAHYRQVVREATSLQDLSDRLRASERLRAHEEAYKAEIES